MTFSQITRDDVDPLSEIEFENMSPYFISVPDFKIETVQEYINNNFERTWKFSENELKGFYYWAPDEDYAFLLSIQVPKTYQHKGFGSKLLEHFYGQAQKNGFYNLALTVHKENEAYNWYLKKGFVYTENDGDNYHLLTNKIKP